MCTCTCEEYVRQFRTQISVFSGGLKLRRRLRVTMLETTGNGQFLAIYQAGGCSKSPWA